MTPGPFSRPVARAVLRTQSDDRLVALARRGSEAAFTEVVRRYRQPLVAFAAAYAPSDRAEDVVQESLERAWTAIAESDSEIALKPWLYTIVRNRSLNARRDARHHEPLDENIDGVRQPSEIVLQREELSRVVAAVAALSPGERRALVDSALEGRTHDQIAAELKTTSGAVRGMIYRGRMAVRGAAGAILPLPLVMALLGGGVGATGGATAAAGGASLATKGAAVVAIGAVALTSGVAVDRALRDEPNDRVAIVQSEPDGDGKRDASGGDGQRGGSEGPSSGPGGGRSGPPGGDDEGSNEGRDGEGEGPDDNSGHGGPAESEGPDDHSGPGHGGDGDDGEGSDDSDDSGHGSNNSGSGSSNSGSGSSGSGSGSGSSGSSGSGSSGSGSGSSGSGSGGSGSGGSGSSGHGGGDEDSPEPADDEAGDD